MHTEVNSGFVGLRTPLSVSYIFCPAHTQNAYAGWDPSANLILKAELHDSFCVSEDGLFLDVSSKYRVTLGGILHRIASFLLNNEDGHFYSKIYSILKGISSVKGTWSA